MSDLHDHVMLAFRAQAEATERAIRAMLPIAGRVGCPHCAGRGAFIEQYIEAPLTEIVRRCKCVTIRTPGVDA